MTYSKKEDEGERQHEDKTRLINKDEGAECER